MNEKTKLSGREIAAKRLERQRAIWKDTPKGPSGIQLPHHTRQRRRDAWRRFAKYIRTEANKKYTQK
jgi:hypothetical protein